VLIEQQKVAIMPGYTYGEEGNGFVRLNAGCPRSKLEQGVQRLIAGINTLCNQFAQRNIPLRK
jgi:cystathionine beta-lyase